MLNNVSLSLADLLGEEYISSVIEARSFFVQDDKSTLEKIAHEKVDFYPSQFSNRQDELFNKVGENVVSPFPDNEEGAPTNSYHASQHTAMAPLGGLGCYRIGEDGRLYFAGKSEHYHIPLGHDFPGYRLIELAKRLGIPNATHNNTRGYITRRCERTLIACANGVEPDDSDMDKILKKTENGVLNRVINLETGSLAVEAAVKMMLDRFYTIEGKEAKFEARTPVFLVMSDNAGGLGANYHGTTLLTQTMRGLWPSFAKKAEEAGLYKIISVAINDADDFKRKLEIANTPPFRAAGFLHEIILMNYGGIRLNESYLQEVYSLCHQNDVPILCDEIQSCAWYEGLFLFKKYGLTPDFVSVGKGFPGGCYPASKILASGAFDSLNQFGALVTNGQEELASLAYMITMAFIKANGEHIEAVGKYYHNAMKAVALRHPTIADGVTGDAHMSAICFKDAQAVTAFCKEMNNNCCIDISAQTYKPNCPPVALTKLPLIVSESIVDGLVATIDRCLSKL